MYLFGINQNINNEGLSILVFVSTDWSKPSGIVFLKQLSFLKLCHYYAW